MSSSQISTVNKLLQSRNVIMEILENRGYPVSEINIFSREEIKLLYLNKQLDFQVKNENNGKTLYVKYLIAGKVRNSSLKKYLDEIIGDFESEGDFDPSNIEFIIVLDHKINDSLEKMIDYFYFQKNIYINLFHIDSIRINLTKHHLVPEHVKIETDIFQKLKKKFNLNSRYQLPIINRKDIIAKYIGLKPGEICKIVRPSITSGEYTAWRCCK
jgi:DNA-directed RNA polymerases I, II, and III subunit RPABC1